MRFMHDGAAAYFNTGAIIHERCLTYTANWPRQPLSGLLAELPNSSLLFSSGGLSGISCTGLQYGDGIQAGCATTPQTAGIFERVWRSVT